MQNKSVIVFFMVLVMASQTRAQNGISTGRQYIQGIINSASGDTVNL